MCAQENEALSIANEELSWQNQQLSSSGAGEAEAKAEADQQTMALLAKLPALKQRYLSYSCRLPALRIDVYDALGLHSIVVI